MIPLYKTTAEAKTAQPQADVLLNFASFRTAYDVTMEALEVGGFSSKM
jgi:ATP-citrate lyase alpha-subunit